MTPCIRIDPERLLRRRDPDEWRRGDSEPKPWSELYPWPVPRLPPSRPEYMESTAVDLSPVLPASPPRYLLPPPSSIELPLLLPPSEFVLPLWPPMVSPVLVESAPIDSPLDRDASRLLPCLVPCLVPSREPGDAGRDTTKCAPESGDPRELPWVVVVPDSTTVGWVLRSRLGFQPARGLSAAPLRDTDRFRPLGRAASFAA